MDDYTILSLQERPGFDLVSFMDMSHETRLGGATLERLEMLWEKWSDLLSVKQIQAGKISYLAVWLPKQVEEEVEGTWKNSPSDGFLMNTLAQFLCMTVIQELLPEVEDGGCAPSPRPTQTLRKALSALGVPYKNETSSLLSLPYAVVTHFPFKGGCEICHLQDHCPKGQGRAEDASILLPGFEKSASEEQ
ncbi:MAG: hypothetical protein J5803_01495 [Desulfovibrio sp.]|nr:hypothetical protein [Desulfovibrio sp.]